MVQVKTAAGTTKRGGPAPPPSVPSARPSSPSVRPPRPQPASPEQGPSPNADHYLERGQTATAARDLHSAVVAFRKAAYLRPDDPAIGPRGPRHLAPAGSDHNRFVARVVADVAARIQP